MKPYTWISIALLSLAVAVTGCGNKSEVKTADLEKSFQSAEPNAQNRVNKAVAAIQSADYSTALADLQKVAAQAKLTPEQEQVLKDVIEQVKAQIAKTGGQAAEGATKAVGDLQKSLPK